MNRNAYILSRMLFVIALIMTGSWFGFGDSQLKSFNRDAQITEADQDFSDLDKNPAEFLDEHEVDLPDLLPYFAQSDVFSIIQNLPWRNRGKFNNYRSCALGRGPPSLCEA